MPKGSKAKTKSAPNRRPYLIVLGVLLLLAALVAYSGNPNKTEVSINDAVIKAEVATSVDEHRIGLGGRESLDENAGMLFVFYESERYGFWMKGMQFPLDIIWIDDTKQIVHIEKDVPPESYPQPYYPNVPARYVLEVNAGYSEMHDFKLGDKVFFNL